MVKPSKSWIQCNSPCKGNLKYCKLGGQEGKLETMYWTMVSKGKGRGIGGECVRQNKYEGLGVKNSEIRKP